MMSYFASSQWVEMIALQYGREQVFLIIVLVLTRELFSGIDLGRYQFQLEGLGKREGKQEIWVNLKLWLSRIVNFLVELPVWCHLGPFRLTDAVNDQMVKFVIHQSSRKDSQFVVGQQSLSDGFQELLVCCLRFEKSIQVVLIRRRRIVVLTVCSS